MMDENTEKTGLVFFGTVTASISHEIKNRMAIINEQAGLLEDLVLMAERSGGQVDLASIKRLSNSVRDQVRKGDFIIKNMNRFAHSADTPRRTVELRAMLDLTTQLAARAASLKGVRLEVDSVCPEAEITTDPFSLIHLIWLGIESVLGVSTQGDVLHLTWQKEPDSVTIRLGRETAKNGGGTENVTAECGCLAKALAADILSDPTSGSWRIRLPKGAPFRPPAGEADGGPTNSRKEE